MNVARFAAAALLALTAVASAPAGPGAAQEARSYAIVDPVLGTRAWTLTLPAGWNADGTMLPGSSCNNATSPVYRATSGDGGSGAYFLPRSDWAWGAGARSSGDCLPWHAAVSAKDFLTYLVRIRKVGFVREEPVTAELADLRRNMGGGFADMARYLVRYEVGGRTVDEWLTASVTCRDGMVMGVGQTHGCSAFVTRWFAPQGSFAATMPAFKTLHLTLDQQWMQQWTAVMVSRTQRLYQGQTEALLAQGRLAQSQRMQAHQDFMASMERGRDVRNMQFQAGQYRKQRNNDNYVDYILDCSRAYSGTTRVSSGNCPNRQTF